jgi:hypothetical protein
MKRAAKIASSLVATTTLAVLLFLFLVNSARAPVGGKRWSGGRTIASLQEEDFDRRLLKLQLCYGVKVIADQCTLERRRVCKALVVHELEKSLGAAGNYLKTPVEFHCQDTAVGKTLLDDEDSVSLRPNGEIPSIHGALNAHLGHLEETGARDQQAREACEFLTDCKWSMRPQTLSLRKLASCISSPNATHRKLLLSEAGAMLFGGKAGRRYTLYSRVVQDGK